MLFSSLFALSSSHTSSSVLLLLPLHYHISSSPLKNMERGGFHGYHHKLPRMISSSDMTQMNGKQVQGGTGEHPHMMMSHGATNGMIMSHGHGALSNGSSKPHAHAVGGEDPNECTVREQDRFMPIANVIRIMRKTLPPHAKISDDAKETIQECVSEFISFITGEANERCQREQRKTITAEDILWAMSKLGFDDYVDPLTLYLHRYREMEGDRGSIRGDPSLVKRSYDFSSSSHLGIQGPYPPVFHMPPGYYGPMQPPPPPCNGCGGGPGHPGFEPYGQQNKG